MAMNPLNYGQKSKLNPAVRPCHTAVEYQMVEVDQAIISICIDGLIESIAYDRTHELLKITT